MSKKAAVFCPNPGVDRVYRLTAPLVCGGMFRAGLVETSPGSKGANAALALSGEGVPVTVLTFTGGGAGEVAERFLTDCGITVRHVPVAAGVRENIKLVEPGGRSTEVNERGGPVSREEAAALLSLAATEEYDVLLLCGSLPEGVPADYYASAITAAKARGAVTFLDTSGEALEKGVAALPDYIKPNAAELAALMGEQEPETLCDAARLAQRWQKENPETAVLCTVGKKGAVYAGREGVFCREAPTVTVYSTVGAGDAFLAGFAAARMAGKPPEIALDAAVACATAHITQKR